LEEIIKKTVIFLVAVVFTFSFLCINCKNNAIFIGIAMPENHALRWIKDGNSLKVEAELRGYRAQVQWADGDQLVQNQQIEDFLKQGAKALIIGNNNDGVCPAIEAANRENIVIIAYDRIIQGTSDYGFFITFNNYKVGQLQGQSIIDGTNLNEASSEAPLYITLFAGSSTDANANFFFQAQWMSFFRTSKEGHL